MKPELIQDCWNHIGVQGDKSCPELERYVHCRNCPTQERAARALLDREPPPGYVEDWTRLLAQPKPVSSRTTEAAVVFQIGTEWLALRARCWVEVVALRPVRRVPHRSSQVLAGLVSVRGEILICCSLLDLLELKRPEPSKTAPRKATPRLMVARKDRVKLAFPADDVLGLHRFAPGAVAAVPATNAHAVPRFCEGLLSLDDRQAGLLDDDLLFRALARELA